MRPEAFRPAFPLVVWAGGLFLAGQLVLLIAVVVGIDSAFVLTNVAILIGAAALVTGFVAVLRLVRNADRVAYLAHAEQREREQRESLKADA